MVPYLLPGSSHLSVYGGWCLADGAVSGSDDRLQTSASKQCSKLLVKCSLLNQGIACKTVVTYNVK